jgi:hypothetical protein
LLFAGAVLLLISYIFIALLAKDTYHAHRLAPDGRMATATVIKNCDRSLEAGSEAMGGKRPCH